MVRGYGRIPEEVSVPCPCTPEPMPLLLRRSPMRTACPPSSVFPAHPKDHPPGSGRSDSMSGHPDPELGVLFTASRIFISTSKTFVSMSRRFISTQRWFIPTSRRFIPMPGRFIPARKFCSQRREPFSQPRKPFPDGFGHGLAFFDHWTCPAGLPSPFSDHPSEEVQARGVAGILPVTTWPQTGSWWRTGMSALPSHAPTTTARAVPHTMGLGER